MKRQIAENEAEFFNHRLRTPGVFVLNNSSDFRCRNTNRAFRTYNHRLHTGGRRQGAALLVAMVCIVLASVILAALLRMAVLNRRQIRTEESRLQAEWLVESAIERTVFRLRTNPDYPGESWRIPAAKMGGRHSGLVTIRIQQPDSKPNQRIMSIEVRYPADAALFVKRSKQMTLQLPNSAKESEL